MIKPEMRLNLLNSLPERKRPVPERKPPIPEQEPPLPKRTLKELSKRFIEKHFKRKRFIEKHLKGKRFEDEEKERIEKNKSITGKTKSFAIGALDVGARIIGAKLAWDGLRYITQSYFTKKEQEHLAKLYRRFENDRNDFEAGDHRVRTAMENKETVFLQTVEQSNFMTSEQKNYFVQELNRLHREHKTDEKKTSQRKQKEIQKIFDKTIRTRVELITVLNEMINSVGVFTGAFFLRATGYGVGLALERYREISRSLDYQNERGIDRAVLQVKRWVCDGFRDTAKEIGLINKPGVKKSERRVKRQLQLGRAMGILLFGTSVVGAAHQEYKQYEPESKWTDMTKVPLDNLLTHWEERTGILPLLQDELKDRWSSVTLESKNPKKEKMEMEKVPDSIHLSIGNFYFLKNEEGQIMGVTCEEPISLSPQQKIEISHFLNKSLNETTFAKSLSLQEQSFWHKHIEEEITHFYSYLLILEHLKTQGFSNTPESSYLEAILTKSIMDLHERYGKVFKTDNPRLQKSIPSLA